MIYVFFITILLGLIFQKSKPVMALQVIVCIIIFSFNTDNPDFDGYFGTYYSIRTRDIYWDYFQRYDPLYKFFVVTCNKLGISFNGFRFIVFLLCLILVITTIYKMTDRVNLALSLYMIFPFIMDCIQIRNMIGGAIIVFSMRYLVYPEDISQTKKNMILYIACVIIAALFHYVSIIYLLYLIVFFPKRFKSFYKIGLSASILLTLLLFRSGKRLIDDTGYLYTNVSWITFVFLAGLTIALIIVLYDFIKRPNISFYIDIELRNNIFRFLITSTVFIPVLIFHYDMFRFIRNILLVYSSLAGLYINKAKMVHKGMGVINIPMIAITLIFTVCYGMLLWRTAYYPYDISLMDQVLTSIEISW